MLNLCSRKSKGSVQKYLDVSAEESDKEYSISLFLSSIINLTPVLLLSLLGMFVVQCMGQANCIKGPQGKAIGILQ